MRKHCPPGSVQNARFPDELDEEDGNVATSNSKSDVNVLLNSSGYSSLLAVAEEEKEWAQEKYLSDTDDCDTTKQSATLTKKKKISSGKKAKHVYVKVKKPIK